LTEEKLPGSKPGIAKVLPDPNHQSMKVIIIAWACLAAGIVAASAAPAVTNAAPVGRVLIIEPSSMSLPTAKATLTISPLTRTNGVYTGDYKLKVFPYFFKNEKGRLAINVPDDLLAYLNDGRPVTVGGTATAAKTGRIRRIGATAMPVDFDHGTVTLWFMSNTQKMTFTPAYHFVGKATMWLAAKTSPPGSVTNRPTASPQAVAAGK
jgi:hypothetical protein